MIEKDPSTRAVITQRHADYYIHQLMAPNDQPCNLGQIKLAISRLETGHASSSIDIDDINARLEEIILRNDIKKIP